jgi:hypothetical protein
MKNKNQSSPLKENMFERIGGGLKFPPIDIDKEKLYL